MVDSHFSLEVLEDTDFLNWSVMQYHSILSLKSHECVFLHLDADVASSHPV